jgi:hypothetical protein
MQAHSIAAGQGSARVQNPIRPVEMFDREFEWSALAAFAADERAGATLGVVSGRRLRA